MRELDRATRDRFGEIVFRFFFGSLYRNGHFSGDPHPGNYRLMPDGRVAFIDFGMTKRVDARRHRRRGRGACVRRWTATPRGCTAGSPRWASSTPPTSEITPEAVFEHFHDVTAWYIEDRELTVDRALVAQVLIDFGDPRSRHWQLMRRETMPPQAMLARRMEALTLGVLGQLGRTANWHRIAASGCSATRPPPSWASPRSPSTPARPPDDGGQGDAEGGCSTARSRRRDGAAHR